MRKYILYGHDGSGNHGCEAIVRSTISFISTDSDNIVLVSKHPEEDHQYGVDSLCKVIPKGSRKRLSKISPAAWKAYFTYKIHKNRLPLDWLHETTFANVHRGDVALSIGGDSYCYGFADQLAKTHAMWKHAGLKTVYWGCSVEPELLKDSAIAADIQSYDLITARETISYEALHPINPNTILVSDSAFLLKRKDLPLPDGFDGFDLVGINLSPLVQSCECVPGITKRNFEQLIAHILNHTDMKILLIPHVIWAHDDDRVALQPLFEKYAQSNRIHFIQDCSCEELKGYIARCKFFVGARTHATIAAYSSFVPTLTVGYSIKSKGIARDLFGTYQGYVRPVQEMKTDMDLTHDFIWLQEHAEEITAKLQSTIPDYTKRVYRGLEALHRL